MTSPRTEFRLPFHNCFTWLDQPVEKAFVLAGVYDSVMRFDKRIRFAAVVDSKGRILEGGMRAEVEPIEPLEKTPQLISQLIARESAESRAVFFGDPEYSIFVHEKLMAVIYYLEDGFVLVTTQRLFPLGKVPSLRKRLINKQLKSAKRT
jgi:hypothetical protein